MINFLKVGALAFALALSGDTLAQTLFINDATVYTMETGGVLQSGDILVRNGIIQKIDVQLEPPVDAEVIEAGGRPVTPGFFAGITSLGLVEIGAVEDTADSALAVNEGLSYSGFRPEFNITLAYNPNSSLVPVTRIEGLTWTMLGALPSGSIIGGLGRSVLLDGGYDSFVGERALFIDVGGDSSSRSGGSRAAQWMLLDQALAETRSKDAPAAGSLLTTAGREALRHSADTGLIVFDADRASDVLQVIRFSQRHELNAIITGGTEAWMVADELAQAGIPVFINALSNLPSSFDQLGARLDNAALLNEAGVTVSFAGAGSHNARKLRQVAGNAVANGLPYEVALEAMTRVPAEVFRLGRSHGRLTRGGRADLVIWSGDPLEVTTAADQVIVRGQLDPMISRQTLLRDRYLPQQPQGPRAYINP